jgi:hypothetical protein
MTKTLCSILLLLLQTYKCSYSLSVTKLCCVFFLTKIEKNKTQQLRQPRLSFKSFLLKKKQLLINFGSKLIQHEHSIRLHLKCFPRNLMELFLYLLAKINLFEIIDEVK